MSVLVTLDRNSDLAGIPPTYVAVKKTSTCTATIKWCDCNKKDTEQHSKEDQIPRVVDISAEISVTDGRTIYKRVSI